MPPRPAAAVNWERFTYTSATLDDRVRILAAGLRAQRPTVDPAELAGLRLTAEARNLLGRGLPESAVDLLERAIALSGRNGFAYLFLAYAHHQLGRPGRAAGFVESAGQYLPVDVGVRAELEGLRRSVAAAGGSPGGR